MANYNVIAKIIRGSQGEVEDAIEDYINSIDNTKTIRSIVIARYGTDQIIVLIVHDA